MKKVPPLIVFSVLLLFPVGVQYAAGGGNMQDFQEIINSITESGNIELFPPTIVNHDPIDIPLKGKTFGLPVPEFDTSIELLPNALIPAQGDSETIDVEIVQLELVSSSPIMVSSGNWDVKVELGLPFPTGTMTVNKNNPNGGTFSSSIPVMPKFIFTRSSDGTTVEDFYEFELQIENQPWEHNPCPNSLFPTQQLIWQINPTNPSVISGSLFQNPILSSNQCLIGGQILLTDSTSLILGAVQSFSWMIPVTLSILGIGILVITRKSAN